MYLENPINQSSWTDFPLRRFDCTSSHICLFTTMKYGCHIAMSIFSVSKNFSFLCISWLHIKGYACLYIYIWDFIHCTNPFLMISCFSLSFEVPIVRVAKTTIRIKWCGLWERRHYFSLKLGVRAIDHKREAWQGSVITITRLITKLHGWLWST